MGPENIRPGKGCFELPGRVRAAVLHKVVTARVGGYFVAQQGGERREDHFFGRPDLAAGEDPLELFILVEEPDEAAPRRP